MRWAKTLLCTSTHTSVRFQTDCISLSTEKSYCKNRGLIWPVTITPSISHLLCNVRIFFMGEEFPFIGSKCENHCYCPRTESRSAWLQHSLHFHVPCFCISTKPAARITGSKGVGSAPGKILSSPLSTTFAHTLLHEAQHRIHYPRRDCRSQIPRQFFQSAIWPSLASLLRSRIWPNIP